MRGCGRHHRGRMIGGRGRRGPNWTGRNDTRSHPKKTSPECHQAAHFKRKNCDDWLLRPDIVGTYVLPVPAGTVTAVPCLGCLTVCGTAYPRFVPSAPVVSPSGPGPPVSSPVGPRPRPPVSSPVGPRPRPCSGACTGACSGACSGPGLLFRSVPVPVPVPASVPVPVPVPRLARVHIAALLVLLWSAPVAVVVPRPAFWVFDSGWRSQDPDEPEAFAATDWSVDMVPSRAGNDAPALLTSPRTCSRLADLPE